MAHEILSGPRKNLVILRIFGDLTHNDLHCDEALGLNTGRLIYLLTDISKMHVGLPEDFLEGVKHSFFVNENMAHMALYLQSPALRAIAMMVAKVTRREKHLSLHDSYDAALKHLLQVTKGENV